MKFSLSLFIARRYFFAKKTQRAINIISIITTIAVAVGTFALVVVLSVFNGFEGLVIEMFNKFDPNIKVSAKVGKSFIISESNLKQIKAIDGVAYAGLALEENVLLKYGDQQFIGAIKGIDNGLFNYSGLKNSITSGNTLLNYKGVPMAIVGEGVANKLSVNFDNAIQPLTIYFPNKEVNNISLDPSNAFKVENISIGATFSIQHEFDSKYIITPLNFVQNLLGENIVSSIEIYLNNNADVEKTTASIRTIVGADYNVKGRDEQHEFLYKIMRAEKWAVFFILLFILIIATFNLTGALTMLIIDKRQDIFIMKSFGVSTNTIKQVFIMNGFIITFIGVLFGLLLGVLICWLQIRFGFLQFNGEGSFVVDAYPVKIISSDLLYIFAVVMFIGGLASVMPVFNIFKNNKFNLIEQ
jgi:lipoprotein-releasing system permease protein